MADTLDHRARQFGTRSAVSFGHFGTDAEMYHVSLLQVLEFVWRDIHMAMETLVLQLSGSSHASSPPSGSKSASNCRFIPLLSTPACARGLSPSDTAPAPASVVQNTPKNSEQSLPLHSDLSSVLKGR